MYVYFWPLAETFGLWRVCFPPCLRLERPAVLPCVAQTGVVSPVGGDQAPGITRLWSLEGSLSSLSR